MHGDDVSDVIARLDPPELLTIICGLLLMVALPTVNCAMPDPPAATVTVTRLYTPVLLQGSATGVPQLVPPPVGAVPGTTIDALAIVGVPVPVTVYVYVMPVMPEFAVSVSVNDCAVVPLALVVGVTVQPLIVPQLLADTFTRPPLLVSGADAGLTVTEQVGVDPPPASVHETSRFPPLGDTETVVGVQVRVPASAGGAETGLSARLLAIANTAALEIRKIRFMTKPR